MKKIFWIILVIVIGGALVFYYFLQPAEAPATTADGNILNPDGSITTINEDGSELTINPDGSFTLTYPDGYEYSGDFVANPDPGTGTIDIGNPIGLGLPYGGKG